MLITCWSTKALVGHESSHPLTLTYFLLATYITPLPPTAIDKPLNGLFDFKIESAPSNGLLMPTSIFILNHNSTTTPTTEKSTTSQVSAPRIDLVTFS